MTSPPPRQLDVYHDMNALGIRAMVWVYAKRCPFFPSGRNEFSYRGESGEMALVVLHGLGKLKGRVRHRPIASR